MELEKKIMQWRHFLHTNPEYGFEEIITSDFIAKTLESLGIEVHRNIGKTGVVGILKRGNSKKSIGLRADFDALPIHEENTCHYKSQNTGMMHGCGHDGHTAMLLGAAYVLAQNKDFNGTIYFIFQPAEEQGTGAKAMIADGLFTRWRIDSVYAMHNFPGLAAGSFAISPNAIMASENHFTITIMGSGGHAAMPYLGSDPIVVACSVVSSLQTIITRYLDPINETAVLSITDIKTNGGENIIPSTVTLTGNLRCFSDKTQTYIKETIEKIVHGQCLSADMTYHYEFSNCVLATINHPDNADIALRVATSIVGKNNIHYPCKPYCTSEDFSFMQREVPSCYVLIGNGIKGEKGGVSLHLPTYDFNDDILMIGVQFWVSLIQDQL